jgi:hypothetical protein
MNDKATNVIHRLQAELRKFWMIEEAQERYARVVGDPRSILSEEVSQERYPRLWAI